MIGCGLNFSLLAVLTAAALVYCQPQTAETENEAKLVMEDPVIARGLQWLSQQVDPSFGYRQLTAQAVAALQLANTTVWYGPHNLLSILTVQQMKIQLLSQLARDVESAMPASTLAEYSLAISSVCEDARNLHGVDVVALLSDRQLALDWDLALTSLAVCTAGAHVHKRQLRKLLDATRAHDTLTIDTMSMVMMALHCVVQEHRNRHLHHYLSAPTAALGRLQKPDGSFGGFKTTTYAMQALQACDPAHRHWDYHAAVSYLTGYQQRDGFFRSDVVPPLTPLAPSSSPPHVSNQDLEETILALLALGPKSLVNIRDMECQHKITQEYSLLPVGIGAVNNGTSDGIKEQIGTAAVTEVPVAPTPAPQLPSQSPSAQAANMTVVVSAVSDISASSAALSSSITAGKVLVHYTVWVHGNASIAKTINVSTEPGSNFYYVMQLAAQQDNFFAFEATEWPNGHYIHTLGGWKETPMSYCYWLLYKLPSAPQKTQPPSNQFVAPLGVDNLIVSNNDFYLFWYKKL